MSVSVKVTSHTRETSLVVEAAVAEIVAKAAFDIEAGAKQRAPVDTGALENSIQAEQEDSLTWIVGDGVNYGVYQELGTHKMPAHPFLVPATEAVRPSFLGALREAVR